MITYSWVMIKAPKGALSFFPFFEKRKKEKAKEKESRRR